jgi:hypothetical protein
VPEALAVCARPPRDDALHYARARTRRADGSRRTQDLSQGFNKLLDCAESDAARESCIDGWLLDASSLLPEEADREYARGALGYYMDQTLRGHDEQLEELCAR